MTRSEAPQVHEDENLDDEALDSRIKDARICGLATAVACA